MSGVAYTCQAKTISSARHLGEETITVQTGFRGKPEGSPSYVEGHQDASEEGAEGVPLAQDRAREPPSTHPDRKGAVHGFLEAARGVMVGRVDIHLHVLAFLTEESHQL